MPVKQWWAIRDRFRRTLPASATASYFATVLNMQKESAQNNILPSLHVVGLIDDQCKPTELAVKWRDDKHYKEVCEKIRKAVYPRELLDLAPDEKADRKEVERWFARDARVGENAAGKMTAFYMLLCEADPTKATENKAKIKNSARSGKQKIVDKKSKKTHTAVEENQAEHAGHGGGRNKGLPEVHLNIQLHFSPEASVEQIDQIFASMAKHLKDFV